VNRIRYIFLSSVYPTLRPAAALPELRILRIIYIYMCIRSMYILIYLSRVNSEYDIIRVYVFLRYAYPRRLTPHSTRRSTWSTRNECWQCATTRSSNIILYAYVLLRYAHSPRRLTSRPTRRSTWSTRNECWQCATTRSSSRSQQSSIRTKRRVGLHKIFSIVVKCGGGRGSSCGRLWCCSCCVVSCRVVLVVCLCG